MASSISLSLFNLQWYLGQNPDVAEAVRAGSIDASEHFQQFGKAEGRSPGPLFNTQEYLNNNPDVAAAVENGDTTAFDHFTMYGASEGRSPLNLFDAQFYLSQNPDVALAVDAGAMTAVEHFVLFGQGEPRQINPAIDLAAYLTANPDVAAGVQAGDLTALDHLMLYGINEGRDLGNGVSLADFANDPKFNEALAAGNTDAVLERVSEVAPFIPGFKPPAGWAPAADTPIPVDFVPVDGATLIIPEGVNVPEGTVLPDAFTLTFLLTESTDTFQGNAGNDIFNSPAGTLQSADALDGKGGIDTLNVTLHSGIVTPTLNSIENINISVSSLAGSALSLEKSVDSGARISVTGTGRSEITGLTVPANHDISYKDYSGASVLSYQSAAFDGDKDAINVNLSGADVRLGIIQVGNGSGAIETLTLNSQGAAVNKFSSVWSGSTTSGRTGVGSITTPGEGGHDIKQYVVTGSQSIEMSFDEGAFMNGMKIDASALVVDATATVRADVSGNDDFGSGVEATRAYSLADLKGVEKFEIFSGTDQAVTGERTINGIDLATTLTVATQAGSITVNTRDSAGAADTFKLVLDHAKVDTAVTLGSTTVNGVETLNLVSDGASAGGANAIAALSGSTLAAVNITGASALTLGVVAAASKTLTVDGSAATGALTISAAADAAGKFVIIGGAGADTLSGGAAADTLTGGAGQDTFAFGAHGSVIGVMDAITDFNAGGLDRLTFDAATVLTAADASELAAGANVNTSAGGLITFHADDNTLAQKVAAVQADVELGAAHSVGFFEDSGNTYVYYAGAVLDNADDQLIQLTGVTGLSDITAGAHTTIA